jgi:hypothetical protein
MAKPSTTEPAKPAPYLLPPLIVSGKKRAVQGPDGVEGASVKSAVVAPPTENSSTSSTALKGADTAGRTVTAAPMNAVGSEPDPANPAPVLRFSGPLPGTAAPAAAPKPGTKSSADAGAPQAHFEQAALAAVGTATDIAGSKIGNQTTSQPSAVAGVKDTQLPAAPLGQSMAQSEARSGQAALAQQQTDETKSTAGVKRSGTAQGASVPASSPMVSAPRAQAILDSGSVRIAILCAAGVLAGAIWYWRMRSTPVRPTSLITRSLDQHSR